MILDGTSSSFFLYLFPYRSLERKRDFDTENLGFWVAKKFLMHRISDFHAEKRFWCTESQIFMQKKDFNAENLRFWSKKEILIPKISDFGVEKRFSCTKCRSRWRESRLSEQWYKRRKGVSEIWYALKIDKRIVNPPMINGCHPLRYRSSLPTRLTNELERGIELGT